MKKTVALIYGGEGVEGSISRCSAKNLYSMISKEKYEVIPVFISHGGSWYISDTDPFGALPTRAARPSRSSPTAARGGSAPTSRATRYTPVSRTTSARGVTSAFRLNFVTTGGPVSN